MTVELKRLYAQEKNALANLKTTKEELAQIREAIRAERASPTPSGLCGYSRLQALAGRGKASA